MSVKHSNRSSSIDSTTSVPQDIAANKITAASRRAFAYCRDTLTDIDKGKYHKRKELLAQMRCPPIKVGTDSRVGVVRKRDISLR